MDKPFLISIIGPTAVGKTDLSIHLAEWLQTDIISADSRQLYREMDIGTAKPSKKFLNRVKHHFVDSLRIHDFYTAGDFGREASKVITSIHKTNPVALAVGGSTLYLKAIWEGFDEMPEVKPGIRESLNQQLKDQGLEVLLHELADLDSTYYNIVDRKNGQRVIRALEVIRSTGRSFTSFRVNQPKEMPYEQLRIGLHMDREQLFDRINQRMGEMIVAGLFEEARRLYPLRHLNALRTVGYTEIFDFMDGKYDEKEAIRLLKRNSRRYAKRQLTWFKKQEDIHWFEPHQSEKIKELIKQRIGSIVQSPAL